MSIPSTKPTSVFEEKENDGKYVRINSNSDTYIGRLSLDDFKELIEEMRIK